VTAEYSNNLNPFAFTPRIVLQCFGKVIIRPDRRSNLQPKPPVNLVISALHWFSYTLSE